MPNTIPLLYLCSIAGFFMVVGGMYLIAKEKIYIDRETGQVTEIELPWGMKFKSNVPALALFVLGFVPLILPIQWVTVSKIPLTGKILGEFTNPVQVYAVIDTDTLLSEGQYHFKLPRAEEWKDKYKVLVVAGPITTDRRPDGQSNDTDELRIADLVIQPGAQQDFEPVVKLASEELADF